MPGWFQGYKNIACTTGLNLTTADLRLLLIDTADHTISESADVYLDDITAGAIVSTSGTLTTPTMSGGQFDADDPTFSAVTGDACEAVIMYHHTGTAGTSLLICYWDGLSITPNGGDIVVTFGTPVFG